MNYPKRLIEVDLPIARISAHARREKSIRHGHISTLHIWWARRPLAACRAVICAALWPDPADETCPSAFREAGVEQITRFAGRMFPKQITAESRQLQDTASRESFARWESIAAGTMSLDANAPADMPMLRMCLLDFIADFANWDNSTVPAYLETSRALTQTAHEALGGTPGTRPLVVDPFAGGGSIPLEALRVGADAFASDLNPIPVLLNKVVLEYIPKYGQRLADEVRKWGQWIKEQAQEELGAYYPSDDDGATPIAYLWARTILSEDPGQGNIPIEVPLMRSLWLSKKASNRQALRWQRDAVGNVLCETVKVKYTSGKTLPVRRPLLEIFSPKSEREVENGTMSRGSATCPVTGFTTPVASVRRQMKERQGGASDARLFCVVTTKPNIQGRFYRLPTAPDGERTTQAAVELQRRIDQHSGELSLVPNEPLPPQGSLGFRVQGYGMNQWGDLFTPRQILALTTLVRLSRQAGEEIRKGDDVGLAEAVVVVLSSAINRLSNQANSLSRWNIVGEKIEGIYSRQAIPMVWDYAEVNPSSRSTGNFGGALKWVEEVTEHRSSIIPGHSTQASADAHPLPNDAAHCFFSDPPYYDAVPYADLSDFFYVWFKRTLGDRMPDLFTEELTPKTDECIVDEVKGKDYRYFETMMGKAMAEGCRVLAPQGIGCIVFAHKSTAGWEAQLQAMVDAGWIMTASWPIDTEMGSRLRAMNSAALASSVHLVVRPRENEDGTMREETGEWRDVLSELPQRIHEWMPRLAAEGVVGADAIFACLGPALEIFSRYSRVEKASGEQVLLREYLEQVWATVSTEALSLIFKDADAAGLEPDARLTAMWLWTLGGMETNGNGKKDINGVGEKVVASTGYTLEFDAARKIAQGLGIHLEQSDSIVEVKGDKARLLPVGERTRHLFGKDEAAAPRGRKKKSQKQMSLFEELDGIEADSEARDGNRGLKASPGNTVLDRIHQAMILFAAGRGEALRRFLVDDGAGTDARFWKLAQSLSALYSKETDEKRWVDGVLARKKGLGL
jgi:putative DNA methylase